MRTILLHVLRDFRFELGEEMSPNNPNRFDPENMEGVCAL